MNSVFKRYSVASKHTRAWLRPVRRAFKNAIASAEAGLLSGSCGPTLPPIFIIGLPRVGSTLIYQSLVQGLGVSYLCNAADGVPKAPALVTRLLHRSIGIRPPRCFESRYGGSAGWLSPSQGRDVWAHWFPADQSYCGPGSVAEQSLVSMRKTVGAIERAFGMPFLNKAQGHAVRIGPLNEAFPNALFIRVQREMGAIAESILRGRRDCFRDDGHWFSAKPSIYASLTSLDPPSQIAGQIRGITADIDRDLSLVDARRVFTIDYDHFCSAPRSVVAAFADFYRARTGITLALRYTIPPRFSSSTRERVSPLDSIRLRESLEFSKSLAARCVQGSSLLLG